MSSRNPGVVVFYGVVDGDGESVIEFCATREQAEMFIAEVERDESETAQGCGSKRSSSWRA